MTDTLTKIFLCAMTAFLFTGQANAAGKEKYNFFESSDEIVRALNGENNKPANKLGKTRSLFGGNTRSLKRKKVSVMRMDKASGKAAETEYETGNALGNANLKIEFDFNSDRIRPASHKLLDELGKALNNPKLKERAITIAGHTDSVGENNYNQQLSLRRARAVSEYLADHHGINPSRFEIIGFGEAMPLVSNTSKTSRQLNRRVEIISR